MADDGGLTRFQKRMRAVPQAVKLAVQPALITSANEVSGHMKTLAPERTGDLKDSITVTAPGQTTPPYSQPGGSRVAGEHEALVTAGGKDVRYAHLVEHGTSDAPAQPFFWPGFRLGRKRAANRIKRAIGKAVREAWGQK